MNDLKMQLQRRLLANILMDKCMTNNKIIFQESWCTQDRIIRFTTPFFRSLFTEAISEKAGYLGTGDRIMFEIHLLPESFCVDCLLWDNRLSKEERAVKEILSKLRTFKEKEDHVFSLKSWTIPSQGCIDKWIASFDSFMNCEIDAWENDIWKRMNETDPEKYYEGNQEKATLSKYERNPKARAACLAYHGTACAICGIDFESAYGSAFAGKIEVHHVVPISQIGDEYEVDPIHDLVPVCPNCHMILHSKPGGNWYTPNEVRIMLSERGGKQL